MPSGAVDDEGMHGVIDGADVAHGSADHAGLEHPELGEAVPVGVIQRAGVAAL